MKHLKNIQKDTVSTLLFTVIAAVVLACTSNSNKLVFQNASEALSACRKHLHGILPLKEMNMKDLAVYTTKWMELQDTTYMYIIRDSNAANNIKITDEYYAINDSVRNEILRLALAKNHSMEEVIDFKLNTIPAKNKIQESDSYKKAIAFYEESGKKDIYGNGKEMMTEYKKLLSGKTFKNQQELETFLIREDVCYRSLMKYYDLLTPLQLQGIVTKTANHFDKLYQQVANDIENGSGDEYLEYLLTVRLNRRIIQNAKVCYNSIKNGKKIKPYQVDNYRWVIIQPFLTIHGPAMAMLTDDEVKFVKLLASELTDILARIDGMSLNKTPEEEVRKLSSVLSIYFLKAYLLEII